MRPAIATVHTAATWEPRLVDFARQSATMRVVKRCRTAAEVEVVLGRVDAVVVGSETSWLSVPLLRRWRSQGVAVVGIAPPHDRPALRLFEAAGVDTVATPSHDPGRIFGAVTSARAFSSNILDHGSVVTVTGARGAPGRSEVALALAWAAGQWSRTVLLELDSEAPGLGLRLGLEPADDALSVRTSRRVRQIDLVTLPASGGPLSQSLATRLVEISRSRFDALVVDAGPYARDSIGYDAGRVVLVVHPTPSGLVRAGRIVESWTWPAPIVVANRVPSGPDHHAAVRLVRAATGLEPAAAIPELDVPPDGPHRLMTSMLEPLARSVFGSDQPSAAR